MKSFPSSLNESQSMYGSGKYSNYVSSFDIERLKALNLNLSAPVISELLKERNINIADLGAGSRSAMMYTNFISISPESNDAFRENPLTLPYDIITLAKTYNWEYSYPAISMLGLDYDSKQIYSANMSIAPSMFSPFNGVNVKGITSNVPLLNDVNSNQEYLKYRDDLSSCTIRELCALSKNPNSILGMATYRYSDFMYCKDLGKVSNNHLITLRRFAHPVGDHIFELSGPRYVAEHAGFDQPGDIGRLVAWFDTEDNKLEDIMKYTYSTTWKNLQSQIEQKDSTADDPSSGILGLLSNTMSGRYSNWAAKGVGGSHNLFAYIGQKMLNNAGASGIDLTQGINKNNELLRNYDQNRVYNPKNTIQEVEMYEGKIQFSHEFTLTFSYKLRAYDDINPKSAFLDLIGNILEVTGRRGRFWGGERKLIGPPTDTSMFEKTNALIDGAFEKLGGIFERADSLGHMWESLSGSLSNILSSVSISSLKGAATKLYSNAQEFAKELMSNGDIKNTCIEQVKGLVQNALGRPTLIAWQSLLDGSDVGLWHVTIGNPKNPIAAFGNLIVTNSEIIHSGPLGLDDFPTDLKVIVSLKHGRPRDITDISKMYTKGMSSIYHPLAPAGLEKYLKSFTGYKPNDSNSNPNNLNVSSAAIKSSAAHLSKKDQQTKTEQKNKSIDNQSEEIRKLKDSQAAYFKDSLYERSPSRIPNPFITDTLSSMMSQMNNYSSAMAIISADEVV